MDGPLDLNGHLHPPIASHHHPPPRPLHLHHLSPPPQGSQKCQLPAWVHQHPVSHRCARGLARIITATGTSQYASLCCKGVSVCLACSGGCTPPGGGWRRWRGRNKGKLTLEMETARGSLIKRKLLDNGLLKYARLFLLLPLKKIINRRRSGEQMLQK